MLEFKTGNESYFMRKMKDEKLDVLKKNNCNLLVLESNKNEALKVRIIETVGETEIEYKGRKFKTVIKAYYVYDDVSELVLKDRLALEVALELLRSASGNK